MNLFHHMPLGRSEVVWCPMPHVQSISVGLWFRTGSRYEPENMHGAAHFIEHMVFKGTPRRSAFEITESIESRGGDLNAFTSEEMTCYYARVEAERLRLVLDVLFDMLWKSVFAAKEIERERGVILEEMRMYDDQPNVVAHERCNLMLWPDNSLGRPILGSASSVGKFTKAQLVDFWQSHYRPRSLVVAVAGRVERDDLAAAVEPHVRDSRRAAFPEAWQPFRRQARRIPRWVASSRPVNQCHITLGYESVPRNDPRRYAQKLLSVIMGENMSSRLFQVLRERHGLAYSVHTSVSHFHDTGAFYIHAGIDPENRSRTLDLLARELKKIRIKPPTVTELRRAKDYTIGQMKLGMESTSNRMMWMGESFIGMGRLFQPQEVMEAIHAVRAEDVSRLAAELFQPGRLVCSACSPDLDERALRADGRPLQRSS
ncbi:MAG: M16 family metallopeptidase [Candidatus Methylacidiphilales bacterium]